ncbi:MAG TPA: hypothetical protein VJ924_10020, partial [Alphaproteobacteria bacterium]|nr:hypothetical protein [Alphaproteobacteria bacterium]
RGRRKRALRAPGGVARRDDRRHGEIQPSSNYRMIDGKETVNLVPMPPTRESKKMTGARG